MERDDANSDGEWVFLALLVLTVPVFALALLRLVRHLKAVRTLPALLVFYVILATFSLCRIIYFLDVLIHYNSWVYYALDLLPVALIFTAASIVAYLWCQISQEFPMPINASQTTIGACFYWTLTANLLYYILFCGPFLVLYPDYPLVTA